MSDLICIETYPNIVVAEVAKSFLESQGIQAEIFSDNCGGMRPEMEQYGIRLIVREEDKELAQELLKQTED